MFNFKIIQGSFPICVFNNCLSLSPYSQNIFVLMFLALKFVWFANSNNNEILKDVFLGLDVVNSRQAHLTERVSIENQKFYQSEEEFNLAEATLKTK
jgi:hypothetical protein